MNVSRATPAGRAYLDLGRPKEAETALEGALRLDSTSAAALVALAQLYDATERPEEAVGQPLVMVNLNRQAVLALCLARVAGDHEREAQGRVRLGAEGREGEGREKGLLSRPARGLNKRLPSFVIPNTLLAVHPAAMPCCWR